MDEPTQVYAVYMYYPHIDYAELDTLWYDEEEAIKRSEFISKYDKSGGKPRVELEFIQ